MTDKSGNEIIKPVEGQIKIGVPPQSQFASVNLVFNFNNLKFETAGRYSFELYVDSEWKSGLPLLLNQMA